MLSQNNNALGIIFPNSYDNTVPELATERAMASIPFAGRYRMVDFVLSSMANCGISNVSVVVRKNYHSLMDHLGTGREWDMARRHGGLNIVPPFAEKGVRIYSGRVEALGSILSFLENQKERYVVMSDANIAINYDFNALLAAHQASGADVTVAYQKTEIPEGRKNDNYTLTVDADGRVTELLFNDYRPGKQNLDLDIYVMERQTLIKLVKDATARGLIYFERDILAHNVNILNIHALEYTGYDDGVVLVNLNLTSVTELINCGFLEFKTEFVADYFAACEDSDITEHFLTSVAKARSLYCNAGECAAELVEHESCKSFAFNVFCDDEELLACLNDLLEEIGRAHV